MIEKSTPFQAFIDVFLFFLLVYLTRSYYTNPDVPFKNKGLVLLLIMLFCIFPYWGNDYWHYLMDFEYIKQGKDTNLEEIYYSIIPYVPNYFLFRVLIWGVSLGFFLKTIKLLGLNEPLSLFIFIVGDLLLFSYARATLPMALTYWSVVNLIKKNEHKLDWKSFVFSGFALYLAFFLHKSAVFGLIMAGLSILTTRVNKFSVLLVLISIPLLVSYIEQQLPEFLLMDAGENASIQTGQNYLYAESKKVGIAAQIYSVIQRIPSLLMCVLFILSVAKGVYKKFPLSIKILFNSVVLITLCSTLLLVLNTEFNVDAISYRFLYFSWIPIVLVLSYLKSNHIFERQVKWVVIASFTYSTYAVVYAFYNMF